MLTAQDGADPVEGDLLPLHFALHESPGCPENRAGGRAGNRSTAYVSADVCVARIPEVKRFGEEAAH
jgi:hypothetical protein